MDIIFFVKSSTVNIEKYNIKDIPGSSGRLDVISRCILAALFTEEEMDRNIQIWIFLDKYGTYIFNSNEFIGTSFPISEIKLSDYFVTLILDKKNNISSSSNPLNTVKHLNSNIFEELERKEEQGYTIVILDENGDYFEEIFAKFEIFDKLLFVIGDQTGLTVNAEELKDLNRIRISLGPKSYLASSVIKLLKLNHRLLIS